MTMKALALMLAMTAPVPAEEGGKPALTRENARYVGYEIFDPGSEQLRSLGRGGSTGPSVIYEQARQMLDRRQDCSEIGDGDRAEGERAFQRLIATQTRHVTASQWKALQEALREVPASLRLRETSACYLLETIVGEFDLRLDRALVTSAEMDRVIAGERDDRAAAERPVLGVMLDMGTGIREVPEGGKASLSSLRVGDSIEAVDGTRVTTAEGIEQFLRARNPGDTVQVYVSRRERDEAGQEWLVFALVNVELESRESVMARIGNP